MKCTSCDKVFTETGTSFDGKPVCIKCFHKLENKCESPTEQTASDTSSSSPVAAEGRNVKEDGSKTGPVSADEAAKAAQRFIDGHFNNKDREHPRISIPVDFLRDDDVRLLAYINQSAARISELESANAKLKERDGDYINALSIEDGDRKRMRDRIEELESENARLEIMAGEGKAALDRERARVEELEKQLVIIGERAVVDFDDKVVGEVDSLIKPHFKYKDWIATVFKKLESIEAYAKTPREGMINTRVVYISIGKVAQIGVIETSFNDVRTYAILFIISGVQITWHERSLPDAINNVNIMSDGGTADTFDRLIYV